MLATIYFSFTLKGDIKIFWGHIVDKLDGLLNLLCGVLYLVISACYCYFLSFYNDIKFGLRTDISTSSLAQFRLAVGGQELVGPRVGGS